jgi:hypothetical protein
VEVGQVFLLVLRFPPSVSFHQCYTHTHTHTHTHVVLTRRTNGPSLGTFQKVMLSKKSASIEQKNAFLFFSIQRVKVGRKRVVI